MKLSDDKQKKMRGFISGKIIILFLNFIFVIILVTFVYVISNSDKINLSDYTIVDSNDVAEYKVYKAYGNAFSDPIYAEDSKLGVAVLFEELQCAQFVEFYLSDESVYEIDFVSDGIVVCSSYITSDKDVLDISFLPDHTTFDCILIRSGESGKCGIEYINTLDEYEDNMVFQEIPDTMKKIGYTGESFPYNVQGVQAFNNGYDGGELTIEVLNIHTMAVRLADIIDEDGNVICEFLNEELQPYEYYVGYKLYVFDNILVDKFDNTGNLYIRYYIGENDVLSQTEINVFSRFNDELANQTIITTQDNLSEFDFVEISDKVVEFDGNIVTVDQPMFIPSDYILKVNEGQKIDLINDAFIVCRNAVMFDGSEEYPITVYTSDGSGKGLFVCQADEESTVSHTVFDGLNTPDAGAWMLTGAVTFYESDVEINDSSFINNICEDALNLVRCNFMVDQCLFENTFGDAFDADFCNGEFVNNSFTNTGNDGFDVSTSVISVDNVSFEKIGDKAISGGENSTLNITNIEIDNTIIGLASKDSTLITGNNINIRNAEIGITLYQKKPEYTGAYIDIEDVTIKGDIGIEYLIQEDSELIIDHQIIEPKSLAKENILFDRMIEGLSITEFEEQQ